MATSGPITEPALETLLKDAALAGSWTLDPARSTVGLRSKSMWGLASVRGVFGEVSGQGTVSPAGTVTGTLTVAAASVDTRNKKRDAHLRSADFFDSDAHPDITFTVDGIRPSGQDITVSGALTVRDRTRPVAFQARAFTVGSREVRLEAEVRINRGDFGLTWNQLGMASMDNTITVHAVFTRQ